MPTQSKMPTSRTTLACSGSGTNRWCGGQRVPGWPMPIGLPHLSCWRRMARCRGELGERTIAHEKELQCEGEQPPAASANCLDAKENGDEQQLGETNTRLGRGALVGCRGAGVGFSVRADRGRYRTCGQGSGRCDCSFRWGHPLRLGGESVQQYGDKAA